MTVVEVNPVGRVGLVPQQPALIEGTVAANVTWDPRLRDAPVDHDRMRELLDRHAPAAGPVLTSERQDCFLRGATVTGHGTEWFLRD